MKLRSIILSVTLAWLTTGLPAYATTYTEIFQDFQQGLEEQSGTLEENAVPIVLPSYGNNDQQNGGADSLVKALQTLMDFAKLVVAPIMLVVIFVLGIRMVAAGRENDEVTTKAKTYATYAAEGLVAIMIADALVNVFFGAEGEVFRQGEAGAAQFGRQADRFMQGAFTFIQVIIGGIAVFSLITAGFRYVAGSYDDEQISKAKNGITWSLIGLVVVGVSEFVVKEILFPNQGSTLGFSEAKNLLADFTNFAAGFIGTVGFIALLYAGGLYVTARDNEDNVAKAKNIMMAVAVGIVIALMAFAITNTIVSLDATR